MESITINATEYYLVSELKKSSPQLFRGTRTNNELINKYKLTLNENYIYARLNKLTNEWAQSDKRGKALDKLFLLKDWVESTLGLVNEEIEKVNSKYLELPPLINLTDEEKIKDDEGNVYEIEVRGKRDPYNCFFKVKDISDLLEMANLGKTLSHNGKGYERGKHYITFIIKQNNTGTNDEGSLCNECSVSTSDITKNDKLLYLTYRGLMKVFNNSRNSRVDSFVDWSISIMYTAHLGTKAQKRELCANLTNLPVKVINKVLSKSTKDISCIYLIYLGTYKDTKDKLQIKSELKSNTKIYKFGRTNNLNIRLNQHTNTFAKLDIDIELKLYSPIDELYTVPAENEIYKFVKDKLLDQDEFKELFYVEAGNYGKLKEFYTKISDKYAGKYSELNNRAIKVELDHEKRVSQLEKDLLTQKNEYEKIIFEYKLNELKKDNDIKDKSSKLSKYKKIIKKLKGSR